MDSMSPTPLAIICPTLPPLSEVLDVLRPSYEIGSVTVGKVVARFEEEVCRVTRSGNAVAVSSCTSGLMLVFAALGLPEGAEVIVPSFTFAATVQALVWNRLTPIFVDCLPGTLTLDPKQVPAALSRRTGAIYPVGIYGLPPDLEELTHSAAGLGLPLIFDSAQTLGATYHGAPVGGFGLCEVFSLSPTKVVTAIEGGVITTNDAALAGRLRSMRDYGKGPDGQEMIYNGLSARMSEIHAAVGLLSLDKIGELVQSRLRLIHRYRERLGWLPGCRVQELPDDRTSSGNYFVLMIGPEAKADRDALYTALASRGIQSKRYFYPPVHVHPAIRVHAHRTVGDLTHTWNTSRSALALPLYSHMSDESLERVCCAVEAVLSR